MENYQNNIESKCILKRFYDKNKKYLDNEYIGDRFITDNIYFLYYIKNPIFYMIFAQKYLYHNKIIYDYYNDYSTVVKNTYEYRFNSASLLPSLNNCDKDMLKGADITFMDDPRFRFKHLDDYMKCFHTNYEYLYNDNHIEYFNSMLSKEFNEIDKKFILIHINNMINHREIILKFLSKYSSVVEYDNISVVYDNHFIQRIERKDLDLFDPDKFVNQFINDVEEMNKQYIHTVFDIIKNGIIKSEYIESAGNIESINFYTNVVDQYNNKDHEYFKNIKNGLLDCEDRVNNIWDLFFGGLHLLWTNYYHWQPYCELYNKMMSYSILPDENIFNTLCNRAINMINVKYKNNSNKLFYKSYYMNKLNKKVEFTDIINENDNINMFHILSMSNESFNSFDTDKFIISHMSDICMDMMTEFKIKINHIIQNFNKKYDEIIDHTRYYLNLNNINNNSMFSILHNFINNKPFKFYLNITDTFKSFSVDTVIFQEDMKYIYLDENNNIIELFDSDLVNDVFMEFDLEYQKIIKSLKNKYCDKIKNKVYNIKNDGDIETIICKILYLYPDITRLVPRLSDTKLYYEINDINDNELSNNLIKRLNCIMNEKESIRQEFVDDSYLKTFSTLYKSYDIGTEKD